MISILNIIGSLSVLIGCLVDFLYPFSIHSADFRGKVCHFNDDQQGNHYYVRNMVQCAMECHCFIICYKEESTHYVRGVTFCKCYNTSFLHIIGEEFVEEGQHFGEFSGYFSKTETPYAT